MDYDRVELPSFATSSWSHGNAIGCQKLYIPSALNIDNTAKSCYDGETERVSGWLSKGPENLFIYWQFIVLGIYKFGYRMPKVIRHLLAKDSTGQTVQWWKMSNKWLDNICQSILPLTQNWTGKNDDDDEPLQKGYLRLYEVRSQIRLRTAQELEGHF